ncbi:MAG: hypothetical protein H6728_02770 [Myxococcales bacterium]|nr:hypothetical protein [Myxococcales bacterium]
MRKSLFLVGAFFGLGFFLLASEAMACPPLFAFKCPPGQRRDTIRYQEGNHACRKYICQPTSCPKVANPMCLVQKGWKYQIVKKGSCSQNVCKAPPCPLAFIPKCKPGFKATKYTQYNQNIGRICTRYGCQFVSCPIPKLPVCPKGKLPKLLPAFVTYQFAGQTYKKMCKKYVCMSGCPLSFPRKCSPGWGLKKVSYSYKGLSCVKYACYPVIK